MSPMVDCIYICYISPHGNTCYSKSLYQSSREVVALERLSCKVRVAIPVHVIKRVIIKAVVAWYHCCRTMLRNNSHTHFLHPLNQDYFISPCSVAVAWHSVIAYRLILLYSFLMRYEFLQIAWLTKKSVDFFFGRGGI